MSLQFIAYDGIAKPRLEVGLNDVMYLDSHDCTQESKDMLGKMDLVGRQ